MDVFAGPSSQDLGEEKGEGVVYSVLLKRLRCGNQNTHLRWVSRKVRVVLAGTLERLVEHLAPQPGVMDVSQAYRTCFLCTYRSFADPAKVVGMLVRRYLSLDDGRSGDSEDETETNHVVKQEIISFLRLWLETYPQDFCAPPSYPLQPLVQRSHDLACLATLQPLTQGSHELERVLESLKEAMRNHGDETDSALPNGDLPDSLSSPHLRPSQSPLFSMTPDHFSAALTSEDARLFLEVSPPQCLEYIRSPKVTGNAPTVRACIDHFNRVSLVVIATVLGGVAPDARAFVISQWIDIAQQCRLVKNFSSLKAIVSGLQSIAVFRLQKTWAKIANSKLHLFEELSELFSVADNHHLIRDLLNREGTAKYADVSPKKGKKNQSVIGVVPYLGTFLTDLTMIDSAHHDKTQDGLVNFGKYRKLFQPLAELMLYQKSAANYCFCRDQQLLHWLRHTHICSPSESYELSKKLEPGDHSNQILMAPDSPLSPTSPSRVRWGLRQIFNMKGSSVSDYTLPQLSSSPPSSLTASTSERDLASPTPSPSKMAVVRTRSSSMSPSTRRRISSSSKPSDPVTYPAGTLFGADDKQGTEGRVVRVAFSESDHCNYKSLLLGSGDKTHFIIQQSLSKLGITGEPREYNLFQVLGDKRQLIPQSANVFYALNKEHRPTLVIHPKS